MTIKLPPHDRPQGSQGDREHDAQDEPSLVLSVWHNLRDWLIAEATADDVHDLGADAFEAVDDVPTDPGHRLEDEHTTRIDPVRDLSRSIEDLAALKPGPMVSAMELAYQSMASDAALAESLTDDLAILKRLLIDLRATAWDDGEERMYEDALALVDGQLQATRSARRLRSGVMVAAAAYVIDAKGG